MPIPYIIILVIVVLIIIFLYFIEPLITRQKIKDNNEHGSARWSTFQEIKKNFRKEKINNIIESGFPVYYSKDNIYVWFDMTTPHWIYLGSTGSGKSATAVIPECSFIATAKNKKSVFITDPKGEIFSTTSKMFKDNGYNVFTLDFRNPEYSNHSNLLETAINEYELFDKNEKLSDKEKNEELKYKGMCLSKEDNHTLYIKDKEIYLTKTEYAILKQLLLNPKQVITKTRLLEKLGDSNLYCDENSLKVHMSNIRKKIKSITEDEFIESVWGIGFKMKE